MMMGCPTSREDLGEIFNCCDVSDSGTIVPEDVIFLEADPHLRDLELFKSKIRQMTEWKQQIAEDYLRQSRRQKEEQCPSVVQKQRLAPRPWQAKTFEKLPTIACQQRWDRHRDEHRRGQRALEAFRRHLRETYGNEVRAMRRALDPESTFGFSRPVLRYYC